MRGGKKNIRFFLPNPLKVKRKRKKHRLENGGWVGEGG